MNSLRWRLLLSTCAACLVSVAIAGLLDRYARQALAPPGTWLGNLLAREPAQDAFVLLMFGLALLALIALVTAWSLRPIQRARDEAATIGPRSPEARLSAHALPAELRPLAEAVNGALERLADALSREQRFLANAAHELRTPLAVLALRLRRARDTGEADWPVVEADLASLTRRVNQILGLARLEAGTGPRETLNLARIARETVAHLLPLAEAAGRRIAVDLPESLPVAGSGADLADAIRNGLDNALQHGSGTITLRAWPEGGQAVLHIADEGAGVPAADREAIFERFQTRGQGGAGLGLAILREVARAHGGTASFLDAPNAVLELRLSLRTEPTKQKQTHPPP